MSTWIWIPLAVIVYVIGAIITGRITWNHEWGDDGLDGGAVILWPILAGAILVMSPLLGLLALVDWAARPSRRRRT